MEGGWINWGQPEVFLTGGESGGRFLYPVSLKNPQRNHKNMWSEGQSIQDKSLICHHGGLQTPARKEEQSEGVPECTPASTQINPPLVMHSLNCPGFASCLCVDLERGAHLEPQSLGGISFLARGQAPSLVSTGVLLQVALPPDFSGWC